MLMKVSGMYVTGTSNHSQTNNKNNKNNNNETNTKKTNNKNKEDVNPSSNISLLDVLLAPSDTMKRLGMGNTCTENGNVASNKNNSSSNNNNNDNNICRILIDAAKDALEGKYLKRKRASIAYMESTVVDISIPPPSFKPVSLSFSRISSILKHPNKSFLTQ